MALASLTVDLSLGLARLEADSGKAAQIIARDAEKMARATEKADAAIRRYTAGYRQVGIEAKVVSSAVAGASDAALKLFASVEGGGASFSRVGAQGVAAFQAIGASADSALASAEKRILLIAEKARQVRDQAAKLTAEAVAQNEAKTLSDDALKRRLADIRTVQAAELERIAATARADADARRAARAELIASSKAATAAQVGSSGATAEAQTRVYLAFATAQAAAAEAEAAAQARVAQNQAAATAASERSQAAQRAAYETKVAYIAKVNEEAAALFRTRDAQRALDAVRAGVSSEQATKLAKFAGDREFLSSVRQQIAAEQKLADEFEKTKAQIAAQTAAQRGLTNTAESAIQRLDALEQANKRAAKAATDRRAAESFLASLNERAAGINSDGSQKAQSQLLAEKAALLGVGKEAEAALAKIALLDGKTGQLGRSVFATRNQLLTLQYTISDVIASAGTGISPLTILLQQGPQLAQVEGGIAGVFRTAVSLITPFRLAMTGAALSIGAVAYAWLEGSKQSKAFNDAIVLSGNFAGQTEGQFNSLTRTISESGQITSAAAREFGQALIATGEVGPEVFAKATRAAALYGQATGQTAKEVAKDFAAMGQDVAKWSIEHNRAMNFVTAAQLEQIRTFQESGKSAEAQALVYDLLNKRLQALEPNLGTLDRAIRAVTGTWAKFWDAAFDVGRAETLDDKLKRAQNAVAQARLQANDAPSVGVYGGLRPSGGARLATAIEGQRFAERAVDLANEAAAAAAAADKLNKQAIAGRSNVEALLDSAKAASQYSKALQKLNADIDANAKAGTPFSDAEAALARAELKKKFTDKGAAKEANDERKAQLDKDLQVFTAALAKEKDALKFQQDELRAVYDTGNLSLSKFYDDREAIIKRGAQAELAEQAKAISRIADELKRGDLKNDERTKIERRLAEAQAKASDIQREADNAAKLATYERAAAVKALTREVDGFQASLKDLEGDPLGAAQLRASQLLQSARDLAARAAPSGGTGNFSRLDRGQSPVDLAAYAKAISISNDFAEVQRKVGIASADAARAEEAYRFRAYQTSVGLAEQEQAIYQLRAAALVQLGELTEAAKRLADASTDPKVTAFAADLALQYARAAQSVDPAFERLKTNGDELAGSLANVFGDAINNGRTFLDLVNNIGRTITASITKTLITQPLEEALKGGITSLIQGGSPVSDFIRGAFGVSGGGGGAAAQAASAQAATLSINQLALSAGQASLALQSIGGAATIAQPAATGGGFFSNLLGDVGKFFGFGGPEAGVAATFSGVWHQGGLVGAGAPARAVNASVFNGAAKFHAGGMPGLQANEVPAILMGGPKGTREEVLHAGDPRHRDNMGQALLRAVAAGAFASGQGQARARPVLRYHSGGVAGMAPDEAWGGGGRSSSAARNDRRGGATYNITLPPGTPRETASQIGARMAREIARVNNRNN